MPPSLNTFPSLVLLVISVLCVPTALAEQCIPDYENPCVAHCTNKTTLNITRLFQAVSGNIPRNLYINYSDLLDFQIAFVHQQQQCTLSKYICLCS